MALLRDPNPQENTPPICSGFWLDDIERVQLIAAPPRVKSSTINLP